MKHFLANPDPDSRVGHPMQRVVLAAHVLVAPVAFAMGMLLKRMRWRDPRGEREGRSTGLLIFGIGLPMVFSLPRAGLHGRRARKASGWLHAVVGVFAPAFALHVPASRPPDDSAEPPPCRRVVSATCRVAPPRP
jgi:hypothetical protein